MNGRLIYLFFFKGIKQNKAKTIIAHLTEVSLSARQVINSFWAQSREQ